MNEIIDPEIAVEWTLACFVIKNLEYRFRSQKSHRENFAIFLGVSL